MLFLNLLKTKVILVVTFIIICIASSGYAQDSIDSSAYIKGNPNVYALLISKNNNILKKTYYNNYSDSSLFNDQSMTKGICSLLMGIAIDKHFIKSVDEKLINFFPELKSDTDVRKCNITIRQVMNQASGLYHEDLNRIYTYLRSPNPSRLVLNSPQVSNPGKVWQYNNAASHLISVIISKATGMDTKLFAAKYLFTPMGITDFEWAKMRDGYYDGSGLLSIRLRAADLLKIGVMILSNGKHNNNQIAPVKWIRQIMTPDIKYKATWGFQNSDYALGWYHAEYKGTKFTYGMGWGGQFLILIPSLQSAIVINESTADKTAIMQSDNFIANIFPLIWSNFIR